MAMVNVPVKIPRTLHVTDAQFLELVKANPERCMERTAQGELIVRAPTGSEGGHYNAELITDLGLWSRQTQSGPAFDSSTGFRLPNGATRAPDIAGVRRERWEALPPEQRRGFVPLCPDFVLALAAATDELAVLPAKMQEYIDNGCLLGWLIELQTCRVAIYRPGSRCGPRPSADIIRRPGVVRVRTGFEHDFPRKCRSLTTFRPNDELLETAD